LQDPSIAEKSAFIALQLLPDHITNSIFCL